MPYLVDGKQAVGHYKVGTETTIGCKNEPFAIFPLFNSTKAIVVFVHNLNIF